MQKSRKTLVKTLEILKVPIKEEAINKTLEFVEHFYSANQKFNLSAHKSREKILVNLVIDSLTIFAVDSFARVRLEKIIDVGSGGGIPGIPLAIFKPETWVALLESKSKKCSFLKETITELGLNNAEVICARAEEAAREKPLRESFDAVLSKALAPLNIALEITIPFLKPGNSAFYYKGPRYLVELKEAEVVLKILGCKVEKIWEIEVPCLKRKNYLIEVKKCAPTPSSLPRKAGIPQKKPLS
ncbi:MAG: 16S rRNA (guanine(527)-N(7))-methyltransferase RsmG [Candidatus Atribacteria bacterium]|nr:16S rRNA (guanine(527)-N(7))-methyltransferase RsmG [Candidatus Atribacteria bacterium]MCD6349888.1 16S rRNA (guanine(527)-N(7))-methyltransferase RsmG [Candidatus Atribacteria bacterium]